MRSASGVGGVGGVGGVLRDDTTRTSDNHKNNTTLDQQLVPLSFPSLAALQVQRLKSAAWPLETFTLSSHYTLVRLQYCINVQLASLLNPVNARV